MNPPKQVIQATLTIYKGLPFAQLFLYQTAEGYAVDLTGKKARLQLRLSADSLDPALYDFSTDNGKIQLGNGTIHIDGMTELETADFDWQQAVGHLVIEEVVDEPRPLAFFLFNVQSVTTGVPV